MTMEERLGLDINKALSILHILHNQETLQINPVWVVGVDIQHQVLMLDIQVQVEQLAIQVPVVQVVILE